MKRLLILVSIAVLITAACTAGREDTAPKSIDEGGEHEPVTITFWTGWTAREFKALNKIIGGFEEKYPWITVEAKPGVSQDQKIIAAINGGNPPDAVSSWRPDQVGKFCSSGAFVDLGPYIEQGEIDMSIFPESTLSYTRLGDTQCALPFLTDTFGLYYNKDLLEKAGYDRPPETIEELTEMAKELTEFNPDGSIKVAGFMPLMGWYENDLSRFATSWGAEYFDEEGNSNFSGDPAWAELFQWQKSLVDWYGIDKLTAFQAGMGDEWSASNAFQDGDVAMHLDGEWRTAFIADQAANLNYGTAPFPYAEDHPEQEGANVVGGTILGLPRGSDHPAEAWLLIEYLATDTDALVSFANLIANVPTTTESLSSPELELPATFDTFMTVFENPKSGFPPATEAGLVYNDLANTFADRWQSGRIENLQEGLEQLDDQIEAQIAQG